MMQPILEEYLKDNLGKSQISSKLMCIKNQLAASKFPSFVESPTLILFQKEKSFGKKNQV